jgi:hypothetical protein
VFETVATAVFDDTQGLLAAAVAEPVNCEVLVVNESVPVIVGKVFTVPLAETFTFVALVELNSILAAV